MKGDFTKNTYARRKHYAGVLMQQGRVELDADWNEQNDITANRQGTTALDTIGASGAPVHAAGFAVVAALADLSAEDKARPENTNPPAMSGPDLLVSGGRLYVGGELAENEHVCLLSDQPDLPPGLPRVRLSNGSDGAFPPPAGSYLAYVDVWPRHVTALEDTSLREVALGGPDTATRKQTVAQVKLLQVATGTACDTPVADWDALTAPSTGKLAARAEPDGTSTNPCIVAPGAGYRRLENQLYRVEIHDGGKTLNQITLKWSRENGSVVVKCTGKNGNDLLVASTGKDAVLGFAAGNWVELVDDGCELAGKPGTLVRLKQVAGNALTVDPATATGSLNLADFPRNPKVRRWDMSDTTLRKADQLAGAGGWIPLEDGVQVKLTAGTLRSGDYWLIPARTAIADVEWPKASAADFDQLPHGVAHRYARLATLTFDGTAFAVTGDCRKVFNPLTELDDDTEWHRRHNRNVHGWGVVCGLQVHCDPDRRFVQVEPGHAIACSGDDLLLKAAARVDVVTQATAGKLLDAQGNGQVELLFDKGSPTPAFSLRAHQGPGNKTVLQQILEGTLLQDVIDDCLKPVIDFLRKELLEPAANDTALVPETTKNRIAAVNLLIQLANKQEGSNVFLSEDEHNRLAKFFAALKGFIAVKAFCGMFDGLPTLPAYPFAAAGVRTLYGKARYRRLAVAPEGDVAWAADTTTLSAHGFPLKEDAATVEAEFPAVAGMTLTVQDAAFLGKNLVLAASGPDGAALCLFDPAKGKALMKPVAFPEANIVRLGNSPSDQESVYALVKGQGLFRLSARNLEAGDLGEPLHAFNATGELAMGIGAAAGNAVATSADKAAGDTATYTGVEVIDLAAGRGKSLPLRDAAGNALSGNGGLAILLPPSRRGQARAGFSAVRATPATARIYVGIGPAANTTQKRVLVIEPTKGTLTGLLTLPTDGDIALLAAPGQDMMLATMANRFQIARIDPQSNQFDDKLLFPAQILPGPLAPAAEGEAVLVANAGSMTLSAIPAKILAANPGIDNEELAKYRQAMADAFLALFARLGQMVKDCICDHLLVDCPTCGPDDKLVLAAIEVKANKVLAICALERRDVITFPKLFYWLSAVPVIPLIAWAVERFCCARLPALADDASGKTGNFASAAQIATFASLDMKSLKASGQDTLARTALFARHLGAAGLRDFLPATAADSQRVLVNDVVAKPPAAAARPLEDAGATVQVLDYDAALANNALKEVSNVPLEVKAGDKINLYTRDGQVVFYTRETAALAPFRSSAEETGLQREVLLLRAELAARDKRIATLEKNVAGLEKTAAGLKAVQKEIAALKARK